MPTKKRKKNEAGNKQPVRHTKKRQARRRHLCGGRQKNVRTELNQEGTNKRLIRRRFVCGNRDQNVRAPLGNIPYSTSPHHARPCYLWYCRTVVRQRSMHQCYRHTEPPTPTAENAHFSSTAQTPLSLQNNNSTGSEIRSWGCLDCARLLHLTSTPYNTVWGTSYTLYMYRVGVILYLHARGHLTPYIIIVWGSSYTF